MRDFFTQLCEIQKLGQALRQAHSSWKIIQLKETWQNDTWVREICHSCNAGPLVYAQTCIPRHTYLAHQKDLEDLGSRSIGDHFLFTRKDIVRSEFTCCIIQPTNSVYPLLTKALGEEPLFYKRESTFYIGKDHLSISEYFGSKALSALGIMPPC
jgi:chorismate-pyruvate lyase